MSIYRELWGARHWPYSIPTNALPRRLRHMAESKELVPSVYYASRLEHAGDETHDLANLFSGIPTSVEQPSAEVICTLAEVPSVNHELKRSGTGISLLSSRGVALVWAATKGSIEEAALGLVPREPAREDVTFYLNFVISKGISKQEINNTLIKYAEVVAEVKLGRDVIRKTKPLSMRGFDLYDDAGKWPVFIPGIYHTALGAQVVDFKNIAEVARGGPCPVRLEELKDRPDVLACASK